MNTITAQQAREMKLALHPMSKCRSCSRFAKCGDRDIPGSRYVTDTCRGFKKSRA